MILPGELWHWLLLGLLAVLFNATPVLAPPTWAMLAWFGVQYNLPILPLAIVGAAGSTLGRIILALASRWLGQRVIPARRRADAERAAELIRQNSRLNLPALALFAAGPIPKAVLFMAAGIARLPLLPGAIAYGCGRAAMYLGALAAAGTTAATFGDLFSLSGGGALMIGAQVATAAGVFLVLRLDLASILGRLRGVAARAAVRRERRTRPQPETP